MLPLLELEEVELVDVELDEDELEVVGLPPLPPKPPLLELEPVGTQLVVFEFWSTSHE